MQSGNGNASIGGTRSHFLTQHIENGILHRFRRKVLQIKHVGNGIGIYFKLLLEGGLVDGCGRWSCGNDVQDDSFQFGQPIKEIRIRDVIPVVVSTTVAEVHVKLAV